MRAAAVASHEDSSRWLWCEYLIVLGVMSSGSACEQWSSTYKGSQGGGAFRQGQEVQAVHISSD
jgi:hypothetical protein